MQVLSKLKKVELEALVLELQGKLADKPVEVATPEPIKPNKNKNRITIAIGCGIPLLSLAMSKIGGTLLMTHTPLALFAFGLMIAVLVVSLPHLAWSISDITKSDKRASWSLAIALDLSLVLCELVHVYATDSGLDAIIIAVMVTVAITSMVLNCWAFKNNGHK